MLPAHLDNRGELEERRHARVRKKVDKSYLYEIYSLIDERLICG